MTNYPFQSLDEFRDLDSIRAYEELVPRFWSHEEMMDALRYKSRDNARTPMQWSDEPQAGFTTGTPWIAVHPNYRTVNAKRRLRTPLPFFTPIKRSSACEKNGRFWRLPITACCFPMTKRSLFTSAGWNRNACWWSAISQTKNSPSLFPTDTNTLRSHSKYRP